MQNEISKPAEAVYRGEKIKDLCSINDQIEDLRKKRTELIDEIRKEVTDTRDKELPILGILYFEEKELKPVKGRWHDYKEPTGRMIPNARLVFIKRYEVSDWLHVGKLVFKPVFASVGSDNLPGNSIFVGDLRNLEFEPLEDITVDEAKKLLVKVKKELKKK